MSATNTLDLDDLLQESMEQAAKQKQAKNLTKAARLGKLTDVDSKTLHEIELRANWKAKYRAELHPFFSCDCGHEFSFFDKTMIEYHDRAGARRWLPCGENEGTYLPLKRIYQQTHVQSCSMCGEGQEEAEEETWEA